MRKTPFTIILTLGLLILAPTTARLSALEFETGLSSQIGLTYANQWSPGYAGTAIQVLLADHWGPGRWIAGLEGAVTGIGSQVLVPLGYRFELLTSPNFSLETGASFLPGIALFRPAPLGMLGFELVVGATVWFQPNWGLSLTAGPRFTTCPYYSQYISLYANWDVPLSLTLRFR